MSADPVALLREVTEDVLSDRRRLWERLDLVEELIDRMRAGGRIAEPDYRLLKDVIRQTNATAAVSRAFAGATWPLPL
jgi:hypothetical protein